MSGEAGNLRVIIYERLRTESDTTTVHRFQTCWNGADAVKLRSMADHAGTTRLNG